MICLRVQNKLALPHHFTSNPQFPRQIQMKKTQIYLQIQIQASKLGVEVLDGTAIQSVNFLPGFEVLTKWGKVFGSF